MTGQHITVLYLVAGIGLLDDAGQFLVAGPGQLEIVQQEDALHRIHLGFFEAVIDGVGQEQQAAPGVPDDVFDFGRSEIRQDGHDDRAEGDGREVGGAPVGAVAAHDADAVARLDAHLVKNVVELEYLLANLAVGEGGAVEVTVALHVPVIADRVGDRLDEIFLEHAFPFRGHAAIVIIVGREAAAVYLIFGGRTIRRVSDVFRRISGGPHEDLRRKGKGK